MSLGKGEFYRWQKKKKEKPPFRILKCVSLSSSLSSARVACETVKERLSIYRSHLIGYNPTLLERLLSLWIRKLDPDRCSIYNCCSSKSFGLFFDICLIPIEIHANFANPTKKSCFCNCFSIWLSTSAQSALRHSGWSPSSDRHSGMVAIAENKRTIDARQIFVGKQKSIYAWFYGLTHQFVPVPDRILLRRCGNVYYLSVSSLISGGTSILHWAFM